MKYGKGNRYILRVQKLPHESHVHRIKLKLLTTEVTIFHPSESFYLQNHSPKSFSVTILTSTAAVDFDKERELVRFSMTFHESDDKSCLFQTAPSNFFPFSASLFTSLC